MAGSLKTKTELTPTSIGAINMDNKTTPAQLRAAKKYRQKVSRITVDFSPAEAALWERIQSQPNKQGYIKSLIRADLQQFVSE